MTETAQLALIGVLGTFLTGLLGIVGVYLNILLTRLEATKTQADKAVENGETGTRRVMQAISENTETTNQVHTLVNGEKTAMLFEIARLRKKCNEIGIYPSQGV